MADTPNGETVTPGASQNNGTNGTTPPAAPTVTVQSNSTDPAEVERLRKEKEQAEMRANQLKNELEKKNQAEEEARQKALEEQNEFKSLYEQERAKREAFEKEREDAVAKIELETSQNEVFKEFPDDVVELAKETGLTLAENSDDAKGALKAKLTKLSERVSSQNRTGPNNPNPNNNGPSREELLQEHARVQTTAPGETPAYNKLISGLNWVQQAKSENGDR